MMNYLDTIHEYWTSERLAKYRDILEDDEGKRLISDFHDLLARSTRLRQDLEFKEKLLEESQETIANLRAKNPL